MQNLVITFFFIISCVLELEYEHQGYFMKTLYEDDQSEQSDQLEIFRIYLTIYQVTNKLIKEIYKHLSHNFQMSQHTVLSKSIFYDWANYYSC